MQDKDRDLDEADPLVRGEADVVALQLRDEEVLEKRHLLPEVAHGMIPDLQAAKLLICYVTSNQYFCSHFVPPQLSDPWRSKDI